MQNIRGGPEDELWLSVNQLSEAEIKVLSFSSQYESAEGNLIQLPLSLSALKGLSCFFLQFNLKLETVHHLQCYKIYDEATSGTFLLYFSVSFRFIKGGGIAWWCSTD